jgi:hypothetical protein
MVTWSRTLTLHQLYFIKAICLFCQFHNTQFMHLEHVTKMLHLVRLLDEKLRGNPGSQELRVTYGSELSGFQPSTVAKRLARHFAFGRSRVLTPVPPDLVWVFFRGFPTPSHRGMSTGLISQMRQMLGQ